MVGARGTVNGFAYFMFAKIVNMFFTTHMFKFWLKTHHKKMLANTHAIRMQTHLNSHFIYYHH